MSAVLRTQTTVIAVVQTAMLPGLPYTGFRDAILAHPVKD